MTRGSHCTVAAGHPMVVEAACRILEAGGNAFDAVVAAGFAGAVAEPALTSLGGGGFLLARTAQGHSILFDFFVDTPGKGRERTDLRPHFFPITVHFPASDQVFNIGMGSVAVPGTLKGLLHVHARLGRMPLKEVVQPAVEMSRTGIPLNSHQAYFLHLLRPIMLHSPEGKEIFAPGGRYLQRGETFRNRGLADFLETLPGDQGREFYEGELARRMVDDMEDGQGLLSLHDLKSYRVIERDPLEFAFAGHRILSNPPPSFGGSLIALALALLEAAPLESTKWGDPLHLVSLSSVMKRVEELRASGIHALRDLNGKGTGNPGTMAERSFSRGTTHVSITDARGNVASMTNSNGEGSGYIVPGTGVMLNNMMGEDDLHPGGFHVPRPGTRVSSMMSPSLILKGDRVRLALGSGGSKRIRTALTQVILNYVVYGMDIKAAVEAPRLHWDGSMLQVEPGYGKEALRGLSRTFDINQWPAIDVYFGGVHAAEPGGEGAGDPRRGGCARKVRAA